jgi:hypothetical protein
MLLGALGALILLLVVGGTGNGTAFVILFLFISVAVSLFAFRQRKLLVEQLALKDAQLQRLVQDANQRLQQLQGWLRHAVAEVNRLRQQTPGMANTVQLQQREQRLAQAEAAHQQHVQRTVAAFQRDYEHLEDEKIQLTERKRRDQVELKERADREDARLAAERIRINAGQVDRETRQRAEWERKEQAIKQLATEEDARLNEQRAKMVADHLAKAVSIRQREEQLAKDRAALDNVQRFVMQYKAQLDEATKRQQGGLPGGAAVPKRS